ncbi:hypothetical protein CS022_21585 [Veronia nyctiphanis]|uniref:Uncharacterized protein n=1 Tax=Veronia nyctiphanis TaxID=1278244 RepID=A0A4Q0YQ31_9GAMM|nr:hypothetical protein [Veronia nyctiphanis]RXJ71141.1 hypothetical protein CS022_21585 [Veronia nyctiphanis]
MAIATAPTKKNNEVNNLIDNEQGKNKEDNIQSKKQERSINAVKNSRQAPGLNPVNRLSQEDFNKRLVNVDQTSSPLHNRAIRDTSLRSLASQVGSAVVTGGVGGLITYAPSFGFKAFLDQYINDNWPSGPVGEALKPAVPYISNTMAGMRHVFGQALAAWGTNALGRKIGFGGQYDYKPGENPAGAIKRAFVGTVGTAATEYLIGKMQKDLPFGYFIGSIGGGAELDQADKAIRAAQNGTYNARNFGDSFSLGAQKFGYGAAAAFATGATAQLAKGLAGGQYKSLKNADPVELANVFSKIGGLKEVLSRGAAGLTGTAMIDAIGQGSSSPYAKAAGFIGAWMFRDEIRKAPGFAQDVIKSAYKAAQGGGFNLNGIDNDGLDSDDAINMQDFNNLNRARREIGEKGVEALQRLGQAMVKSGLTQEQAIASFNRFLKDGKKLTSRQEKDLEQLVQDMEKGKIPNKEPSNNALIPQTPQSRQAARLFNQEVGKNNKNVTAWPEGSIAEFGQQSAVKQWWQSGKGAWGFGKNNSKNQFDGGYAVSVDNKFVTSSLGSEWSGYNGHATYNKNGTPLMLTLESNAGTNGVHNWVWSEGNGRWNKTDTISFENFNHRRLSAGGQYVDPERQLFNQTKDKSSLYSKEGSWKDALNRDSLHSGWSAWRNGDANEGWKWGENGEGGYAIPVNQAWINNNFGDGNDWGTGTSRAAGWVYYDSDGNPKGAQLFNKTAPYNYEYVQMDYNGDGIHESVPIEVTYTHLKNEL